METMPGSPRMRTRSLRVMWTKMYDGNSGKKTSARPLFPSTLHMVQGKKSRDPALCTVLCDAFFVTGTGVHGIPAFFVKLLR